MQPLKNVRPIALITGMIVFIAGCSHLSATTAPGAGPDIHASKNPLYYIVSARYAQDNGELKRALKLYSHVDNPYAWLAEARIYYVIGESDKALSLVERVIKKGVYVDNGLELRAEIHASRRQWSEAIEDATKLFEKHPDNRRYGLLLADLKMCVSDFKGARKILERLLNTCSDDPGILYTLSRACLGDKDFVCTMQALKKVIKYQPDMGQAYMDLAKVQHILGDMAGEEKTYRALVAELPGSTAGYIALSDLYIRQKRYSDALDTLKRLFKVKPAEEVKEKIMLLELKEGKYKEALEILKARKNPSDRDRYYMAFAYSGLSKWEKALKVLPKKTSDSELACDLVLLRSSILESMDRTGDAIKELEVAWGTQTACKEVGYRLANLLESSGKGDKGLKVAEEILKRNPKDPIALNFVGYVWADKGIRLEKAREMISAALKARPDDCFIMDSMAWVLFRSHRLESSVHYMKMALNRCGQDPVLNEHMGDILSAMGKKSKALDYYLKAWVNTGKSKKTGLNMKINSLLETFRRVNLKKQSLNGYSHEQ